MPKIMSLYSGKFTIDKLITYHDRHLFMCEHQNDRADEAEFHNNALKFLKEVKERGNN